MTRLLTPTALFILCAPFCMAADSGWYANASVGLNTLAEQDVDVVFNGTSSSGKAGFNASFGGGAALGYQYSEKWSAEVEFLYRRIELDNANIGSFGQFVEGDFANTQLSVAGFYHLGLGGDPSWSGYVGAGLAFINEVDIDFEANDTETSFESDAFGVELHGGFCYTVNDRIFVDGGVRWTLVSDVEMTLPENDANTATAGYWPLLIGLKVGWRF